MGFYSTYQKHIIGTVIALAIATTVPSTIWVHNAYSDERYVLKEEQLRSEIRQVDNALFEINQEISFAREGSNDKAKFQARLAYYKNLKEELKEKLESAKASKR